MYPPGELPGPILYNVQCSAVCVCVCVCGKWENLYVCVLNRGIESVGVWGCGGGGGLKGGVRAVRCYLYVGACPPTYIHKVISHHVDACI